MIERLYCDLTESPFEDWYEPSDGYLALPQGPGLGIDPHPGILEKLRVD
jgi:L-alanine-DL-glutamate epimerase-like enolase superfamily enzyme